MPGDLLAKLPAFKGEEIVLVRDQSIPDIIKGVLSRHDKYASHYDLIAEEFLGGDEIEIGKRLFDYVKRAIPYEIETKERQTVRSPGALVAMSDYWGGDCKHYASFIGGVLDAITRTTGMPINWVYRFAGYDILKPKDYGHVFIVINPNSGDGITDGETWVDPVLDLFNSRKPWPWHVKDKRPKSSMALVQVSGVPGSINTMVLARRNRASVIGDIYPGNRPHDASMGDLAADALNAIPGYSAVINTVKNVLPNGAIKDFVTAFAAHPGQALISLIKGRTYTSGDYKLGELYMRNILGMENVQDNEQVPDGYVPQAWTFFSAVMGVRIRTFDDMDALTGTSASPPASRAAAYLSRAPAETPDISMDAATRAAQILGDTSVSKFNMWNNRDVKWPLPVFVSIPYIYPLPGPVENTNFTGVHPILGTAFTEGYPADYTGPRYISQKNQTVQQGTTVNPPGSAVPGAPGTPVASAGLASLLAANPIAAVLIVGGGLYTVSQLAGKKKSVTGFNATTGLLLAGGALALYFLLKKPTTTTPGTIIAPAVVTPVTGGGGAGTQLMQIAPPSGGPGIVISPGQLINDAEQLFQIAPPTGGPDIVAPQQTGSDDTYLY